MTTHLRRAIALIAILITILAALPLAGAAQDTGGDRKALCKHGGWQTLTRADGTPFANQGECIKYIVSEGGTFEDPTEEPPAEGLQLSIGTYEENGSCKYVASLTNTYPDMGKFELWTQYGEEAPRMVPFADGWNGFGINGFIWSWPATFTAYPNGANGMGDPIDTVTIASCGESS